MQSKNVIFAASCLVFSIVFIALLLLSPTGVQATSGDDHKVKICHATSADNNPYTSNNIDVSSVFTKGHDGHTGPVWFPGIDDDWGDIIPSFTYELKVCPPDDSTLYKKVNCKDKEKDDCSIGSGGNKECAAKIIETKTYPGMNWTSEGMKVLRNNCTVDVYEECSKTVRSEGEWSEWKVDPEHPTKEYRERTISYLDSQDNSKVCSSKIDKEYRYLLCSLKYPIFGKWSDWQLDPEDATKEYRERSITWRDFYKHTVCSIENEKQNRDVKYVECSVTDEIPGEWTAWVIDSEDESKFVSTSTVTHVDSKNAEKICSTETVKKYQDRELCEWNTAKYADDPLCVKPEEPEVCVYNSQILATDPLCVKPVEEDEPEVLGVTTTVVHAPTAGEDNVLIYFIEIALITLTSISLVHISKDYLNRN